MTTEEVLELFDYDNWATERVLNAAEGAGEAFLAERGESVGSPRDLLVHLADAQLRWLQRCHGQPTEIDPLDRFMTVAETRTHCRNANALVREYLSTLSPSDLERVIQYTSSEGTPAAVPVRRIWWHVFGHGVHHRAEASELLSRAGHPPEPVDVIGFARTLRSGA